MTQHHIDIIYWYIQAQLPSGWLIQHPTNKCSWVLWIHPKSFFVSKEFTKVKNQHFRPNVCWIKVEKKHTIPCMVWLPTYWYHKHQANVSNYIISLVLWERVTFPLQSLYTHFRSDLIFLRHTGAKFIRYLPQAARHTQMMMIMPGIMY